MSTHERNVNVPDKGQSTFPDIPDLNIGTVGIKKQLLSSNPTKACRPDELPPMLLRTVTQELTPALTLLFNQSYTTGIGPMQWKQAIIIIIIIIMVIFKCYFSGELIALS